MSVSDLSQIEAFVTVFNAQTSYPDLLKALGGNMKEGRVKTLEKALRTLHVDPSPQGEAFRAKFPAGLVVYKRRSRAANSPPGFALIWNTVAEAKGDMAALLTALGNAGIVAKEATVRSWRKSTEKEGTKLPKLASKSRKGRSSTFDNIKSLFG